MASWWRLIATDNGATSGTGSWQRRAAVALSATGTAGQSWARKIVNNRGQKDTHGSWDRRLVTPAASATGPWARIARNAGINP